MTKLKLFQGDCLEILRTMPDASVDAIVTDPPYGLSFMGKKWDYEIPSVEIFRECLRVLKPGGHALVACGTRTQHRMAVNIEDAGFEIRDVITWLYGSGFPKSLDISKAIDKAAGAEREVLAYVPHTTGIQRNNSLERAELKGGNSRQGKLANDLMPITSPSTSAAKQWSGWGTALKPACEFWTLARKPLSEKTVASNVLKFGTGGINVDGCRVETTDNLNGGAYSRMGDRNSSSFELGATGKEFVQPLGRFPANLILDEEAAALLDEQTGDLHPSGNKKKGTAVIESSMFGIGAGGFGQSTDYADSGGASRFFYVAKASKSERNAGCEGMEAREWILGAAVPNRDIRPNAPNANHHPTVKPLKLMAYLCRLIAPPGGTVLDPFMGSGSTGVAAQKEGFEFIGIEREKEYFAIAEARCLHLNSQEKLHDS